MTWRFYYSSGYTPRSHENIRAHKNVFTNAHGSIIPNRQHVGQCRCPSSDKWIKTQGGESYSVITINEVPVNSNATAGMNPSLQANRITEDHLCAPFWSYYMTNVHNRSIYWDSKRDQWLPGDGGEEGGEWLLPGWLPSGVTSVFYN